MINKAQQKKLEEMKREGWQRYYPGGYVLEEREIFILKYLDNKRSRLERKKIDITGCLENV